MTISCLSACLCVCERWSDSYLWSAISMFTLHYPFMVYTMDPLAAQWGRDFWPPQATTQLVPQHSVSHIHRCVRLMC